MKSVKERKFCCVSHGVVSEEFIFGGRTWSSFSDRSQLSSSVKREETSSTEHFFAATLATLSSKRRTSRRVLGLPSELKRRSVFL